jgi:hypothetical protein
VLNFTENQTRILEYVQSRNTNSSVRWTKFTEDQTNIADLMQNTKEEFEIMNNEGYEDDDVNTAFTIIDDSIATLTSISERLRHLGHFMIISDSGQIQTLQWRHQNAVFARTYEGRPIVFIEAGDMITLSSLLGFIFADFICYSFDGRLDEVSAARRPNLRWAPHAYL